MGNPPTRIGGADRDVDDRRQLRRVRNHQVVLGHVGEQLVEVHLLLIAGAQDGRLLHAGDGENRRVVELGVVEAVK